MRTFSDIVSNGNRVAVKELRHPQDVSNFYRLIHKLTQIQGYPDIYIDMSQTGTIFPNAATPFCAALDFYKAQGVDVVIEERADFVTQTHVCDPISAEDASSTDLHIPLNKVWKFESSHGVYALTKQLTESIFTGLQCESGVIESFEWCVNEIMDNVLQHSQSPHGYIMAQIHRASNKIAICIADLGIGLYNSLQSYSNPPLNYIDAITLAIREGVTRDKEVGQGNGMWGLSSIVADNDGALTITSGRASLFYRDSETRCFGKLPQLSEDNPGTIVDFQLNTNSPVDMSKALKYSHINLRLESFETQSGTYKISISENTHGTGTRKSAEMLRTKVINIMAETGQGIEVDFAGVGMISSSFADEFIAKLVVSIGFVNFTRLVKLSGMTDSISGIVEKAIGQRMAQSFSV